GRVGIRVGGRMRGRSTEWPRTCLCRIRAGDSQSTSLRPPAPILQGSVVHRDTRLFFFQAEDGIRDGHVTGVQTCALPILTAVSKRSAHFRSAAIRLASAAGRPYSETRRERRDPGISGKALRSSSIHARSSSSGGRSGSGKRSEERRVGKEGQ